MRSSIATWAHRGPVMITAGHAIQGSARIAATHKHLTDRIVRAILGTERARYKTDECRNIALGHAIKALGAMSDEVRHSPEVTAFVTRQIENPRPATRKKAEQFLRTIRDSLFAEACGDRPGRAAERLSLSSGWIATPARGLRAVAVRLNSHRDCSGESPASLADYDRDVIR